MSDIKREKSSSARNDFNYPPAKALRLAITSGENGETEWKKLLPAPARFQDPPTFSRTPRGRSEATRSSGKTKLKLQKPSNCTLGSGGTPTS